MEQLKIKYVKMPITLAKKREHNRAGYAVVDIRFKPADDKPARVVEEKTDEKSE
jgi:hypothetical protein